MTTDPAEPPPVDPPSVDPPPVEPVETPVVEPAGPPVVEPVETTSWQALLRERGYRLTTQRELVLAAVDTLGHATPDEVFGEVRRHSDSINLSTVYRTLELLDELGLVRHAHLSDRAPTYHSARGHEHAHLVCRACRRSFSVGRDEVETALGPVVGPRSFVPDYGHLTVFGTCADCASEA